MISKSIQGQSPQEIKNALETSMQNGFVPTLAIVFMSVIQDRKAISEILAQRDIDVFGATSCSEFVNGYQSFGEIVLLLMDLSRDAYALLVFSCAGREPALGRLITMENEGLAELWNSPMAGFFSYGEFGRAKNGGQNFHSGTCCWWALKEK
jgi:hypothetical protein